MTGASGVVWLDGGNPFDFDDGELEQLAVELATAVPAVEFIPVNRAETGYGVNWHEVLVVWEEINQDAANTATVAVVVAAAAAWLRKRWHSDRNKAGDRARPRSLVVCNKSGHVVRALEIDAPDGQMVENTERIGELYPRPSPGRTGSRRNAS